MIEEGKTIRRVAISLSIAILCGGLWFAGIIAAYAGDDDQLAALFENAEKLCVERKFDQSLDLLSRALHNSENDARIRERMARVLYKSGRNEDAIYQLKMAVSSDPGETEYFSELAWLYSMNGNFTDAVGYAEQAIRLDPKSAYPFTVLGFSLGNLGRNQQAKNALRTAIELEPKSSLAHLYLADVLSSNKEFIEAEEEYHCVLKLDPGSAPAYIGMGICLQKAGKAEQALACYKKAVELAPDDATARGHLGYALSQKGDYAGALRNGMAANFIRMNHSWQKFIGMFIAVWAGIFLVFGGIFTALFAGSRFKPQVDEKVIGQYLLVLYRDRPGRFVITDRRIVFVPELISQSLGATRVSIERAQVKSISAEPKKTYGLLTIVSTSDSIHVFRMPLLVFSPVSALLNELQNHRTESANKSSSEEDEEKTEANVDGSEISATAKPSEDAEELVTAVSYDFREQPGETESAGAN